MVYSIVEYSKLEYGYLFLPLFFGKHTFKSLQNLRAGGKERQPFRSDCHKIIPYWLTCYRIIYNFVRFTALLFPFLLCFYLVKKLIRFLGNSAIRHYLLAWRVSGLGKMYFSNPRLQPFSPLFKNYRFLTRVHSFAVANFVDRCGLAPLLKGCSRASPDTLAALTAFPPCTLQLPSAASCLTASLQ